MSELLGSFTQAPTERLDYDVDYARWLAEGDEITNVVATADAGGVTVDEVAWGATSAKIWLTGGSDGDSGDVTVTATTSGSRTVVRSFRIRIREC